MNIMIAGLGLIGGSMALALKAAGIKVDGFDREDVLSYALQENMIARAARDFMEYDVVFVALPPKAAVRFLTENSFKKGAAVADVCGVKGAIERAVSDKPRDYRYVGCHPMAGKEVSGIRNADASLFRGASMILVENDRTDPAAAETIAALSVSMGFGRVIRCDSDYHDAKIAYTSQLAHIVSNAYVKSPTADGYRGYTGGSFQDMTRIAGVDEKLWTDLFSANREKILYELRLLISELGEYERALSAGDDKALEALLRAGRLKKEELDRQKRL